MHEFRITQHAITRYRERIRTIDSDAALSAILDGIAAAKPKHFRHAKLIKRTFYIPTPDFIAVGTNDAIVTVLRRSII